MNTEIAAASQLDQPKEFTTVVADTGDFESIRKYAPQDATTNPTLVFKAVQIEEYKPLLTDNASSALSRSRVVKKIIDDLLVLFGRKILAPRTPACSQSNSRKSSRAACDRRSHNWRE